MYHPDRIRQTIAIQNILWWIQNGGDDDMAKKCVMCGGYVHDNYMECLNCKFKDNGECK